MWYCRTVCEHCFLQWIWVGEKIDALLLSLAGIIPNDLLHQILLFYFTILFYLHRHFGKSMNTSFMENIRKFSIFCSEQLCKEGKQSILCLFFFLANKTVLRLENGEMPKFLISSYSVQLIAVGFVFEYLKDFFCCCYVIPKKELLNYLFLLCVVMGYYKLRLGFS